MLPGGNKKPLTDARGRRVLGTRSYPMRSLALLGRLQDFQRLPFGRPVDGSKRPRSVKRSSACGDTSEPALACLHDLSGDHSPRQVELRGHLVIDAYSTLGDQPSGFAGRQPECDGEECG